MSETVKYVKMDCGKHWGPVAGKCGKCTYFNSAEYQRLQRDGCQRNGVPFTAILGPSFQKPIWWDLK